VSKEANTEESRQVESTYCSLIAELSAGLNSKERSMRPGRMSASSNLSFSLVVKNT